MFIEKPFPYQLGWEGKGREKRAYRQKTYLPFTARALLEKKAG